MPLEERLEKELDSASGANDSFRLLVYGTEVQLELSRRAEVLVAAFAPVRLELLVDEDYVAFEVARVRKRLLALSAPQVLDLLVDAFHVLPEDGRAASRIAADLTHMCSSAFRLLFFLFSLVHVKIHYVRLEEFFLLEDQFAERTQIAVSHLTLRLRQA